jgi:hypothetical protein
LADIGAATFDRNRPPEQLKQWYAVYGADVNPRLREATIRRADQ